MERPPKQHRPSPPSTAPPRSHPGGFLLQGAPRERLHAEAAARALDRADRSDHADLQAERRERHKHRGRARRALTVRISEPMCPSPKEAPTWLVSPINGFGRIGRNILRAAIKRGAKLRRRPDQRHRQAQHARPPVQVRPVARHLRRQRRGDEDAVVINGKKIAVSAKRRSGGARAQGPQGRPFALECSGRFTKREDADRHIKAARRR